MALSTSSTAAAPGLNAVVVSVSSCLQICVGATAANSSDGMNQDETKKLGPKKRKQGDGDGKSPEVKSEDEELSLGEEGEDSLSGGDEDDEEGFRDSEEEDEEMSEEFNSSYLKGFVPVVVKQDEAGGSSSDGFELAGQRDARVSLQAIGHQTGLAGCRSPPTPSLVFLLCLMPSPHVRQAFMQWLVAPYPLYEFMEEVWQRRPLVVKREETRPAYYDGWFSTNEVDRLLGEVGMKYQYNVDVTSYRVSPISTHCPAVPSPDALLQSRSFPPCPRILKQPALPLWKPSESRRVLHTCLFKEFVSFVVPSASVLQKAPSRARQQRF